MIVYDIASCAVFHTAVLKRLSIGAWNFGSDIQTGRTIYQAAEKQTVQLTAYIPACQVVLHCRFTALSDFQVNIGFGLLAYDKCQPVELSLLLYLATAPNNTRVLAISCLVYLLRAHDLDAPKQ